ncbi:hypothetical protein HCG49_00815 [Arenibacter sp. 6A1]|nr:hypothetical protein [Arenibacter sp. 6A1]
MISLKRQKALVFCDIPLSTPEALFTTTPLTSMISIDTPKIIGKGKLPSFSVLIPGTAATCCIGYIKIKWAESNQDSLKKIDSNK